MQTVLAASVCHLYQAALVPVPATPLADYTANEADYDSYAAETMAAWFDPILAPNTGYMILSPAVQFEVGPTDPVTQNMIGGLYLLDSAGALRLTIIFTEATPMQFAGQGIPIQIAWLFPTGV
jgi:hypothetical protein